MIAPRRHPLRVALGLAVGLAIFGAGEGPASASCPNDSNNCFLLRPNLLIVADYSTTMNTSFGLGLSRWQAVAAAIINLVDVDGEFFSVNFNLALMRFGHDPSATPGTTILGDASAPPLTDGQAVDAPWYDPSSLDKSFHHCDGALADAVTDKIPLPLGGKKTGIEGWTKGALDRAEALITQSIADHPEDMGARSYALVVITDGAWTDPTGTMILAPPSEDPAITAGDLWQNQQVATHVIYVGDPADLAAKAAADALALAGGTAAAMTAKDPLQLSQTLQDVALVVHTPALRAACVPAQPRLMVLMDASSAMLNVDGGSIAGGMGETGWDQARQALAGGASIFDVHVGWASTTVEDLSLLGLTIFGDDAPAPGEQALLVEYGACHTDNLGWALDPESSCGDGCGDPWGGPPISWTFVDGSKIDPPGLADPTISHMPRCDGAAPYCAGSGAFVHLGLQLVKDHQATYHAAAIQPGAPDPATAETVYANLLVTNGLYASYSTDAQVQAELEAMYSAGITTYVLAQGDGADSPQALAALEKMADWGSGGALDAFTAGDQAALEGALKSIIEGQVFSLCCDRVIANCSLNPEPGIQHECSPDDPNESCPGEGECVLSGDDLYHCTPVPPCGDGMVDPGEACDDGNLIGTDECTDECKLATCGDGKVWAGVEECDDGNQIDDDSCTNECIQGEPSGPCGDEIVEGAEECDDGNTDNTDACTTQCKAAACGDGYVQAGVEACDDGNTIDFDGCQGDCTLLDLDHCGDGVVDLWEGCDDGNDRDDDACQPTCLPSTCGDGKVWAGVEACDDGNAIDDDGCTRACTPSAICGDGVIGGAEACDDGNTIDDDECTNACTIPRCGDGVVQAEEACDDANALDDDACRNDCSLPPGASEGCGCVAGDPPARGLVALLSVLGGGAFARRRRRRGA